MEFKRQEVINRIVQHAKGGERVAHDGINIWLGIDPVGLHSYYNTLCKEKWKKSGEPFVKKLKKLAYQGKMFELKMHVGRVNSRQKWRTIIELEIA